MTAERRGLIIVGIVAILIVAAIIIGVIVNNSNETSDREQRQNDLVCEVAREEGNAGLAESAGCDE